MEPIKSLAKSVAYGVLNLSTAGRGVKRTIGGELIKFPARWCRYYQADYEAETFAFLRSYCKQGQTALDIGAHLGLFSVVMAHLVGSTGHVFSFEPTPHTNEVLKKVIRLNGCEKIVEVRSEAVARSTGSAVFHDTGIDVSNRNSLVQTQDSKHEVNVQTISVDDFAASRGLHIDCLKIDAEGSELDVLVGAERTFSVCRPVVYLALHPLALSEAGGTLHKIWNLLQKHRMSVRYVDDLVDEHWFCQQQDLFDVHVIPQ